MKIESISLSRINTYKDCEWKHFLQYILRFSEPPKKKTECGTIVHHVLEILGMSKKTGHYKLKDKYSDPKYLLDIVFKRFQKNMPNLGLEQSDYKFCENSIEKVLNSQFNPLKLNIIDVEAEFEYSLGMKGFSTEGGEQCKIKGVIDVISRVDKDTIEIIDYKTGQRKDWVTGKLKTLEDFEKDLQLRIYNLASINMFPKYTNRLYTVIFINDGGPFTVTFDIEDVDITIDVLRRHFNEIKDNNNPVRLKDDSSRQSQHWKCRKICAFGGKLASFINETTGDIVKQKFGSSEKIPDEILIDSEKYLLYNDYNGLSLCDLSYSLYRKNQHESLQQLSIDQKILNGKSRSSTFTSNAHKGTIC